MAKGGREPKKPKKENASQPSTKGIAAPASGKKAGK
jgi:hypothetical protein